MDLPVWTKLGRGLAALLIATAATIAVAQDHGQPQKQDERTSSQSVLRLLPPDAVTRHTVETAAGRLDYTATAGTLPLFDDRGERAAAVFYTAYVVDTPSPAQRPVTFVFNGGPGAASAFLHLGLVGPRVAEFGADGHDAAAAKLHDNPHTWLAFTDLVMIDPVGSGYSRPAKPDGGGAFWGVQRDASAVAKTVALWLANNKRSGSPKFLLGESYGGFRAAKVARALRRDQGIAVSGIVMVSPLLEGAFTFGGTRFPLGAAMQIPSLAAAAMERRGEFSLERLAEAERFAFNEYLTTLAGPPPRGEAARAFYARVAEITGMPVEVVTRMRGFIRDTYVTDLRRDKRMVVSRYDASFARPDPYPESLRAHRRPDPLLDGVVRAYSSVFAAYARTELNYKTDMTYVLLASEANNRWEWNSGRVVASIDDDIRALLTLDPSFRLLIANGYTDMVTPYAVSRYFLNHLPDLAGPPRTQLTLYRGGHMFYLHAESRRRFSDDAKAFFQAEP